MHLLNVSHSVSSPDSRLRSSSGLDLTPLQNSDVRYDTELAIPWGQGASEAIISLDQAMFRLLRIVLYMADFVGRFSGGTKSRNGEIRNEKLEMESDMVMVVTQTYKISGADARAVSLCDAAIYSAIDCMHLHMIVPDRGGVSVFDGMEWNGME